MESTKFLVGQLLLATPGMRDPRFERAVIAICTHDEGGALGVGVGTLVSGLGLHDVLDQLDIPRDSVPDAPIHFGGPVETRRGFVIHSQDWSGQGTIDVAGRWSLSGTVDVLRAIASGTGPTRWTVSLGYAGWGAGQLEGELTGPGWINLPGEPSLLYDVAAPDRWSAAFRHAGVDPRLLATGTGTA